MSAKKRVVVTGMGAITPVGVGIEASFQNILKGKTGLQFLDPKMLAFKFKCLIGALMPEETRTEEFHQQHKIRMDDKFFSQSNWIMKEAMKSSGIDMTQAKLPVDRERIGLIIANLGEPLQNMLRLENLRGGKLMTVTNFGITGALALEYGFGGFQGMNANGCAASVYSLGDAYRQIKDGYSDIMFVGGIDTNCGNFSHFILDSVGALNEENKDPDTTVRPYDKNRKGAAQGDGGALLVLESLEVAQARGANILAEIVGYHCISGADNIYKPNKIGYQRVLAEAIKQAGWEPKDIDVLNGHATATLKGDNVEAEAIQTILTSSREMLMQNKYAEGVDQDKRHLKNTSITAFKGNLGHLNLASGATEVALTIKSMEHSVVPHVRNLKDPVEPAMNFVAGQNQHKPVNKAMKLAVGFGGNNAAIAIEKWKK